VLANADDIAEATPFIVFMLQALFDSISEIVENDQVTDQVSMLLRAIGENEVRSSALMSTMGLAHRATFRKNYIDPAIEDGWIERTEPDSPRSPKQRYRLTTKGRRLLKKMN
jgi:predicted transcriptional regulator